MNGPSETLKTAVTTNPNWINRLENEHKFQDSASKEN